MKICFSYTFIIKGNVIIITILCSWLATKITFFHKRFVQTFCINIYKHCSHCNCWTIEILAIKKQKIWILLNIWVLLKRTLVNGRFLQLQNFSSTIFFILSSTSVQNKFLLNVFRILTLYHLYQYIQCT